MDDFDSVQFICKARVQSGHKVYFMINIHIYVPGFDMGSVLEMSFLVDVFLHFLNEMEKLSHSQWPTNPPPPPHKKKRKKKNADRI